MRVACCQFDIAWEDKAENYRRVEHHVREAKLEPATLLLLPEMFATGFSMNAQSIAENGDGPTATFVADLVRTYQIHVLAGVVLFDEQQGEPRNEALLIGPGGERISRYAKVHRFSFAKEDRHYAAGPAPARFTIAGGCTVQPAVCYDLRFPELFRTSAVRGAELICVIANWPAAREPHWMALLKARAIENQAYVAAVNRCGRDPNVEYSGRSQIISPWGDVLEDAGTGERIIRAELDLARLRDYRAKFPALSDVRILP